MNLLALLALIPLSSPPAEAAPSVQAWAVDPLVKVFRDEAPPAAPEPLALAEAARGETATLQIVLRSRDGIRALRAKTSPLSLKGGGASALDPRPARFVGYVPVDRPIQTPPRDQLRKPPADFPDPLLEVESVDVLPDSAQPVWITVPIPEMAASGEYAGEVEFTGQSAGSALRLKFPIAVKVYPAVAGRSRLWVTNWFALHSLHMEVRPEPGTPGSLDLLRRYARNMAEHRQNVAIISPLGLARFKALENGGLEIDFSEFDRWVEIFTEEGVIGRIEGGHIGGRKGGWESPFAIQVRRAVSGRVESASVDPEDPEADRFYSIFLPALFRHLEEKGWLSRYLQHLADEPIPSNIASYRAMARLLKKHAPAIKVIEACHTRDLVGAIDVWVPQLNFLHQDWKHYQERQKANEEVWFYTCVFPQGEYANRFIEQPLLKTRILHWINFRYGVTGYLHWGYNHWTADSPFTHTTRAHPGPPYLPAGDAWIVYPGRQGPLDSIRHEAMRDGIADHELLSLLAEKDRQAALDLAARHVLDFDRYALDIREFRSTRRLLLERLGKAGGSAPPGPGAK